MTMHDDELEVDAAVVRGLIADQFPEFAGLPVREVRTTGTVNAIYRLGEHLYVRLPRLEHWARDLEKEVRWLPTLAPRLTLEIPRPVALGRPGDAFPLPWAIFEWIEGEPYSDEGVADEERAAEDLARFVGELRGMEPVNDAPAAGRMPLHTLDRLTRAALDAADDLIDRAAATSAWDRAVRLPAWHGTPVWIHTDLLRPNVLVRNGRIRAVLDFGGVGVGDPSADVIAAWSVFGRAGRERFRAALGVAEATWERARGYALHQAALIIPYYRETNPGFVALAQRTVREVLADLDD